MKSRKSKKRLRSAARKLSNEQLISLGEVIVDRSDSGEILTELEKYTIKSLSKEMLKRGKK